MKNVQTYITPFSLNVGGIMIIFLIFITIGYIMFNRYMRDQAVTSCMQVGKVEELGTKKGEKLNMPEGYWYNYCMKEKGYK